MDGQEKTGKPILTLENMLQVAAQVMQATPSSAGTASLPTMRVLRVKSVSKATVAEGEGQPCALLDSGATHALRKATSEEEWLNGELVKVALAGGQSITMRMNEAQTLLLPPTPDDGECSKASIVPMGALVATVGYKMEWNQSRCKLIGRNGEEIKLKVRGRCPELSEAQALSFIARLEEDKLKSLNDMVIKSQGRIREAALRLKETWFDRLRRYATTGNMADATQAIVEAPHQVNIPCNASRAWLWKWVMILWGRCLRSLGFGTDDEGSSSCSRIESCCICSLGREKSRNFGDWKAMGESSFP